jgi:hypothetical protein
MVGDAGEFGGAMLKSAIWNYESRPAEHKIVSVEALPRVVLLPEAVLSPHPDMRD